jgi:aminoglycoside 3-N-acetyltransferase
MQATVEDLQRVIYELDMGGRTVMLHSALSSFGCPVERGADGVLDAFLASGCTILVATFSESYFAACPPVGFRPDRNGVDYAELLATRPVADDRRPFDQSCTVIDSTMGSVPATLLRRPGARRGDHPLDSFAALGPDANTLIASQSPIDVYAPIRNAAEQGGAVLLMGVGLNRMTALHLAEQQSGRQLFVRWARAGDGNTLVVETGSCSEGFPKFEEHLAALASTTRVLASTWRAYPLQELLTTASAAIREDPEITVCAAPACRRCRDSADGGPLDPPPLGPVRVTSVY